MQCNPIWSTLVMCLLHLWSYFSMNWVTIGLTGYGHCQMKIWLWKESRQFHIPCLGHQMLRMVMLIAHQVHCMQVFKQVAFKIQGTRTHTRQMWIGPSWMVQVEWSDHGLTSCNSLTWHCISEQICSLITPGNTEKKSNPLYIFFCICNTEEKQHVLSHFVCLLCTLGRKSVGRVHYFYMIRDV